MTRRRRRKCRHCGELYAPDARDRWHQRYCSEPACREASKAASQHRWRQSARERAYKKRPAVERVNSRLDVSYGFERHFIRGLVKMRVRCGLALVVMLATALGRVKEKRADLARSLVRAA